MSTCINFEEKQLRLQLLKYYFFLLLFLPHSLPVFATSLIAAFTKNESTLRFWNSHPLPPLKNPKQTKTTKPRALVNRPRVKNRSGDLIATNRWKDRSGGKNPTQFLVARWFSNQSTEYFSALSLACNRPAQRTQLCIHSTLDLGFKNSFVFMAEGS